MLARNPEEQKRLGYFHTLREICQQPGTWMHTAKLLQGSAREISPLLKGISSLVLSGSGSSEFAGDCVRMVLQKELVIDTQSIAGGTLLTHGRSAVPVGRPGLMVSIARSGDSPESVGALELMLKTEPDFRHLVLTCNRQGSLVNNFRTDSRVTVITLDESTNDQSLVMTSSFTNLVIAARFLGLIDESSRYRSICDGLSRAAAGLLRDHFGTLAAAGKASFRRVLFLGSGSRFAAAREASLKMLEMTAGRVTASCETYLGLRHGPMSAVNEETLIVGFLSTAPQARAYESDVLRELARKQLGLFRIIAGKGVPPDLVRAGDVLIPYDSSDELEDDNVTVLDVVVGQILAFSRCLHEGLQPDSPSQSGVIQRVVQSFALHLPS
ncbi:MAG: SIS domain-containing protein [Acidobacteria bacterium]|nr:SIS domain-containing protein [Acidobacteriota bacterium]